MNLRIKLGIVFVVLGAALAAAALSLFVHNRNESARAEEAAGAVMSVLAPVIIENSAKQAQRPLEAAVIPGPSAEAGNNAETEEENDPDPDTVEINGDMYIGFLTIDDLQLELPVMASWDNEKLKTAPCRHSGTPDGNDLVIAAHNYTDHFGRLSNISSGAEIIFTDVNGKNTLYSVACIETLQPDGIEQMINSEYDLTLFTCTYTGAARLAVRCMKQ